MEFRHGKPWTKRKAGCSRSFWRVSQTSRRKRQKACRDGKELIALLGEMGVALPDEALDAVAGGTQKLWVPDVKEPGRNEEDLLEPQPIQPPIF